MNSEKHSGQVHAREATQYNDAGTDSDQRADQLASASLCMYFAYSLLPNDAANLCNCSQLMNPLLNAISSGQAIRNPCRFSRVATKSAAARRLSGVPVSSQANPRPMSSTESRPRSV